MPNSHQIRRSKHLIRWVTLALIFWAIRLYGLETNYVWDDDVLTLGPVVLNESWSMLLSTTFHHITTEITGPPLPTILLRIGMKLYGPHLFVLRMLSVWVAMLTLALLTYGLKLMRLNSSSRWFTLMLYTLSIPSVIYAQSLQPSLWYFATTLLQIVVFVRRIRFIRRDTPLKAFLKSMGVLSIVSLVSFFANYMSVLIHVILMGGLFLLTAQLVRRANVKDWYLKLTAGAAFAVAVSLPILVLAALRLKTSAPTRGYFIGMYYPENVFDFVKQLYDFTTYHFNFAYDPDIYQPFGPNWYSLPFVLLVVAGLFIFLLKYPVALMPIVFGIVTTAAAASRQILPMGGVRHSLVLAPLLYIGIAYGAESLWNTVRGRKYVLRAMPLLALTLFLVTSHQLYQRRASTVSLPTLAATAQQLRIDTVYGYRSTVEQLRLLDYTQGSPLASRGIAVQLYEGPASIQAPALIAGTQWVYRPPVDWPPYLLYYSSISDEQFDGLSVETLVDIQGPLDPYTMGRQSIYFPINGFHLYRLEPAN